MPFHPTNFMEALENKERAKRRKNRRAKKHRENLKLATVVVMCQDGPDSKLEQEWKLACRERDKYSCQWPGCKITTLRIHVHHIRTRAQRPDLKYEISNGVCLCSTHHDHL